MQVKAISACPDTAGTAGVRDVSEAFSRLYVHYPKVRSFLLARTGDWHLADELAQRTFVKLWEHLAVQGREYPDLNRPMGLLVTMARWELTGWRSQSVRREQPSVVEDWARDFADPAAGPFDVVAARQCAVAAIADLPQDYRRVLALHLLEDLDVTAVAEQTGLTVARVKATVVEGLRRLRAQLGVRDEDLDQAERDRRERARQVYRAAIEAGRPLPLRAVAERFGMSDKVAHQVIRIEGRIGPPTSVTDRVRSDLRAEILAGVYAPGTRMPRSAQLAPRWNTSKATVSLAFRELAAEGLLIRAPGITAGFYVATEPQAARPISQYPRPLSAGRTRLLNAVRADLDAGRWEPGDTMPMCRELAAALDVSKNMINDVYGVLVSEGRLVKTTEGRSNRTTRYIVVPLPVTSVSPRSTPAAPSAPRIPAPRRSPEEQTPAGAA